MNTWEWNTWEILENSWKVRADFFQEIHSCLFSKWLFHDSGDSHSWWKEEKLFLSSNDEILLNCTYSSRLEPTSLLKSWGLLTAYQENAHTVAQRPLCSPFLVGSVIVLDLDLLKSTFIERPWTTTVFLFLYNENCVQCSAGLIEKWDAFSSTQVSVLRHSDSLELQRRGTDPYVP